MQKVNILDFSPSDLRDFMGGLGEPPYRSAQILDWLYRKGADDFAQMTNLPRGLREKLTAGAESGFLAVVEEQVARDGTVKLLLALPDGHGVETVILPYERSFSVCISTQVGCRLGCCFCASGVPGFVRNLSSAEMMVQVLQVKNRLQKSGASLKSMVLMGTGEPLDNWDGVIDFLQAVRDPARLGMSLRQVTLSTAGLAPRIRNLAEQGLSLTLAVSLHAAEDALRDKLMPINKKYPLAVLLSACDEYAEKTGRRVTFEYLLLENINDGEEHAKKLARLLRGRLCHVNLMAFNATEGQPFLPSGEAARRRFADILARERISVTFRRRLGAEIAAACGQLRNRFRA